MSWSFRVIDTGSASAAMNMALDEAILMEVSQGHSPSTIRFYRWDRPSISLGYFQRATKEIDFEAIQKKDFDFVRRMTGGRAVLHDRELTYSVTVPDEHELAKSSIVESYRKLSLGLQEGFSQLGLHAEVVSLEDEGMREKFKSGDSAACFDSPSWYELVVEGKKIAGSAQVRSHGGLLQHGSLLLDLDVDDLFDVLLFRSEKHKQLLRQDFDERAISVKQLAHRDVSYEEAKQAFSVGMQNGLPCSIHPGSVTEREWTLAHELLQTKYSQDSWNFRR
nr:lipoate--protein ligase family protein [Bacilli bacterium]